MTSSHVVVSSTGERAVERPQDRSPSQDDLARAPEPWGGRSVALRVGSLVVSLDGLDDRLAHLVERHYERFLADGAAVVGASDAGRVAIGRAAVPHYLYLPRAEGECEEARVGARSHADGVDGWSYFFAGRWHRDRSGGSLHLCRAEEHDTAQAIENYLRFYLSAAALRVGGFILHSAGVIRRDRAWLFFGPSGAGKSTTASNAGDDAVLLGDDLVLVEPAGESFRACGVPFRGSFEGLEPNAPACAPVAMACRLFQAEQLALTEVPRSIRVAELLGEVPFLLDDEGLQRRAFDAVERFVRSVPVRRLSLRPDGSFWSAIDAEA